MSFPAGASICQCAACGRTFANVSGFDAHRDGPIEGRACLEPALIGFDLDHPGGLGYTRAHRG